MKNITRRTLIAGLGVAALPTLHAQEFPTKPIRLIVPYPPGGASDITARLIADKLSKKYGTQVLVDNRAGANGIIGTELIARAAPDGYTIGLVASSHVGNPFSYKRVPFDTLNDLQPITQTANVQLGLAVHPKLNVNNVRELVALLKAQPGKIDFASTGAGGQPAPVRRPVHAALGDQDEPCAVQGQFIGPSGFAGRRSAGDVRRGGSRYAARQVRAYQVAGCVWRQTRIVVARCADLGRGRR